MNVTIYDVAREANVSMATVSRVVNGNPNVKPATRKKVQDAIKDLGYRPNAVARGLASKKTTTVGVIIPDISNLFYAELARGIEDIATMYKYNIILSNSDENSEKELHLFNSMLGKQVDGMVLMSSSLTDELIDEIKRSPVPVVLAAAEDGEKNIPSVRIDYVTAVTDAMKIFFEKGHKRVAFIGGPKSELNVNEKLEGYRKSYQDAGLEVDESLIWFGDHSYESGMEAFDHILESKPTAIFVCNDEMSIGVIHAAQDRGYNVPNDFEVIGFDDTKLSIMVRPQLTTVVQPIYDIGAVAMRLLTKYMNKETVEEHSVILPHRINVRNSTR